MNLISSAFEDGGQIPAKYTCDGVNVSPPLAIESLPGGTKSIVIIMSDPDAPGGDWVHWTIWNIDPSFSHLSENETPPMSTEGITDFGNYGYSGPCPPSGIHRYQFHAYALTRDLMLNPDTNKEYLLNSMHGLILEEAVLTGLYSRENK